MEACGETLGDVGPYVTMQELRCQPGDRIQVLRNWYTHWGLCVAGLGGEGGPVMVVHVQENTEQQGARSVLSSIVGTKAIVKEEPLGLVVGDSKVRVNNSRDATWPPRYIDVIIAEALSRVGQVVPYTLLNENCEAFVNELRYGRKITDQGAQGMEHVKNAWSEAKGKWFGGTRSLGELVTPFVREVRKYNDNLKD